LLYGNSGNPFLLQHLGAASNPQKSGERKMPEETADTCIDPEVGELLHEAISGALRPQRRERDRKRFENHMKECRTCRKAMVDHLNETVTIPALKQFAKEKGLTFDEVFDAFAHGIEKMKRTGS
jgi:hypothetical protein